MITFSLRYPIALKEHVLVERSIRLTQYQARPDYLRL